MTVSPVLALLAMSTVAAACGALGALAMGSPSDRPRPALASASALAAGLMLGAGYLLIAAGLDRDELPALLGAALGIAYTAWIQRFSKTAGEVSPPAAAPSSGKAQGEGRRLVLRQALHSASEGVAIGVATVLDLGLGLFLAGALALHNIAEGVVLAESLAPTGRSRLQTASAIAVAKATQPLLALATFALAPLLAPLLPLALGFAAGTLLFLVLTELLPESYQRTSANATAIAVTLATGALLLLQDILL